MGTAKCHQLGTRILSDPAKVAFADGIQRRLLALCAFSVVDARRPREIVIDVDLERSQVAEPRSVGDYTEPRLEQRPEGGA